MTETKKRPMPWHEAIPNDLPGLMDAISLSTARIEAERSFYRRLYDRFCKVEASYRAIFKGGTVSSTDGRKLQNVERNLKISVRRAFESAIRADITAEEALVRMTEAAADRANERYQISVPKSVKEYIRSCYEGYESAKAETLGGKSLKEFI